MTEQLAMSLEAWGDCDPAADQPMSECGACNGSGLDVFIGAMRPYMKACSHCNGTGEVPEGDEDE